MKNYQNIKTVVFLLFTLVLFTGFYGSNEHNAIKTVIEKEMTVLADKDLKAWAASQP